MLAIKYTPKQYDEIIQQKELAQFLQNSKPQNMIISGPAGIGKTTLINIYVSNYDTLKLNSFNLDISQSISSYVKIKHNASIRFIVIDEADSLSLNMQYEIKYHIDQQYPNIYFILICNYIDDILVSLSSKLNHIVGNSVSEKDIIDICNKIMQKENIKLNNEQLHFLCNIYNNDLRKIINSLNNPYIIEQHMTKQQKLQQFINSIHQQSPDEKYIFAYDNAFQINELIQLILSKQQSFKDLKDLINVIHKMKKNISYQFILKYVIYRFFQ